MESEELKKLLEKRNRDLMTQIKRIADAYKINIISSGAVASGNLKSALENEKNLIWELDGNIFSIYFKLPNYWKWSPEEKAKFRITKPTKKMVIALTKWIKVKGLSVPYNKKGVPQYEKTAYAIGKRIIDKGWRYEPKHILKNTVNMPLFDEVMMNIANIVIEEIDNAINNEINDVFNDL